MRRSLGRIAALAALLAILCVAACDNAFGKYENPIASNSPTYQGYPTVASLDEIAVAGAADLSDSAKAKLTLTSIAGASSYRIQIALTGDFAAADILVDQKQTAAEIAAANQFSIDVRTLRSGTLYWRGCAEKGGTWGKWSAAASFDVSAILGDSVPPREVLNLTATPGNAQVTLAWTEPSDSDYMGAEISAAGLTTMTVAKGTAIKLVGGLTNGTPYSFTVKTFDGNGNKSQGATAQATPSASIIADSTPPANVGSLIATAGDAQVTLSWNEPSDSDYAGVEISASGITTLTVGKGTRSKVISGLNNGTAYTFLVKAYDSSNNKASGASASATPRAATVAPAAPTDLTATAGAGQVSLSWTASNEATSYNLYYKAGSTAPTTSDSKISAISGTAKTVTGLTPGTAYMFAVSAVNAVGESALTGPSTAIPTAVSDTTPPANPNAPSAIAGNAQVTLGWTNPSDADFAAVEISWTPAGGSLAQPVTVAKPGTSQVISGLNNGTSYTFTLKSKDGSGNKSAGTTASATPSAASQAMEMVNVTGGTFTQNSRQVTLSDYSIGKYEVTFEQYDAFCAATSRSLTDDNGWGRATRPIINVTWYDAVAFCNWLSSKEGLQAAYSGSGVTWTLDRGKTGYRLPTEAEWEYAAMGGASTHYYTYSGSNDVNTVAWINSNAGNQTHPVGGKAANELGIYDMSGNVWEWNHDWMTYSLPSTAETDPVGPATGSARSYRGAGYLDSSTSCAIASRASASPSQVQPHYGFRVVRSAAAIAGTSDGTISINPAAPGTVTISGWTTLSLSSTSATYTAAFTSISVAPSAPYQWYVDSTAVGSDASLTINPSTLTYGAHVISLFVKDQKGLIHSGSLSVMVTN